MRGVIGILGFVCVRVFSVICRRGLVLMFVEGMRLRKDVRWVVYSLIF